MRLRGTKTEKEFREELQRSHDYLFGDEEAVLRIALSSHFPDLRTAYVIEWIPEHAEDIYLVLVDNVELVKIEIERCGSAVLSVEHLDLRSYEMGLNQISRIKLAIVHEMGANDLKRTS